ncbi:hypothetical protein CC79DRAFT_150023 [Sarocladium strictum]
MNGSKQSLRRRLVYKSRFEFEAVCKEGSSPFPAVVAFSCIFAASATNHGFLRLLPYHYTTTVRFGSLHHFTFSRRERSREVQQLFNHYYNNRSASTNISSAFSIFLKIISRSTYIDSPLITKPTVALQTIYTPDAHQRHDHPHQEQHITIFPDKKLKHQDVPLPPRPPPLPLLHKNLPSKGRTRPLLELPPPSALLHPNVPSQTNLQLNLHHDNLLKILLCFKS